MRKSSKAPSVALPRLGPTTQAIADSLIRFAVEFGFDRDDTLVPYLAVIAFANGVTLGTEHPSSAGELERLLEVEAVPPEGELAGLTTAIGESLAHGEVWTGAVAAVLIRLWRHSADCGPALQEKDVATLRVLHGLRAGLVVAREDRAVAGGLSEYIARMKPEQRFLAQCIGDWRNNNWRPTGEPFVEFVASGYSRGSLGRIMMSSVVASIFPIAKKMNDRWRFAFWAEVGFNTGRAFAHDHPGEAQSVIENTPVGDLRSFLGKYRRCVLGTARPDGEVQIERAALRYIGEHADPDLSRAFCTGAEPRRLARVSFDFSFWAGIYASHPLPAGLEGER
jgi:hypothetical protein